MTKKKETKTFYYKEEDLENAIKSIESINISDSLRSLLTNCLKTCLSINSLLQKNRSLRRLIGRLFGFKSEKKKTKIHRNLNKIINLQRKTKKKR